MRTAVIEAVVDVAAVDREPTTNPRPTPTVPSMATRNPKSYECPNKNTAPGKTCSDVTRTGTTVLIKGITKEDKSMHACHLTIVSTNDGHVTK